MNRITFVITVLAVLIIAFAATSWVRAGDEAAQPPLPAGHPDISTLQGGGSDLPAGHPAISGQPAAAANAVSGTLVVQAVQSTSNGPKVAADHFSVEFYSQDQLLDSFAGTLDQNGAACIGGIPLPLAPHAVVKITHAGVAYEARSAVMTSRSPEAMLQIPVYETTDKAPAWQIDMQHVIVERLPGAIKVTELIAADNPSDRAWVGNPTIALSLPAHAEQVKLLSGFTNATTKIADGKLTSAGALTPGLTQYQLSFVLPESNGNVEISLIPPAPVQNLMILAPDDGTTIKSTGLTDGGVANMGRGKSRFFTAQNVQAGKELSLTISGISSAEPAKQEPR
jgi:hypothetical protein